MDIARQEATFAAFMRFTTRIGVVLDLLPIDRPQRKM